VLTATASHWARPVQPTTLDAQDAESRFRELQAQLAKRLGAEYVHDRLDIADVAVSLGRRTGSAEYAAWGLARRIDALAQLGDRIALEAELAVLDQVVTRLQEPSWTALLLRLRAVLAFADGRLDDYRELSDQAVACAPGDPWTTYLHLVMSAHAAEWSGTGLAEVEPLVRAAIEGAPFFARGWLALVLVGLGRKDEAGVIWRAIAPHVQELPRGALESFIAKAGHARLCAALADREHAAVVYQELAPFADLWVCAMADGPCDGPVRLQLSRLAILLDDLDLAGEHAAAALRMAESSHSLPFVADAHLALAEIAAARAVLDGSTEVIRQAQLALAQARQFGLKPLAERAQAVLTSIQPRRAQLLTGREEQVVGLLADGLTNRAIARRLQLSERTVENHVSHVLTKTGHTSRSGVAAWYAALRN
jgi:DNA-binding NarL/FixJ family response regulator